MHFGQILVNIFSQTCKVENSISFDPIFLNPKNLTLKNFRILKPEKLKPEPTPKRQLNSNPKKFKLDQALSSKYATAWNWGKIVVFKESASLF